jgi:predicted nucleotidyltransferase
MIVREKIARFVDEVARQFKPQRIVLFGSYAYGQPDDHSDVDLLVIMPHEGHNAIAAASIRKRIRAGFPMDLVVRSPDEVRQRIEMGDTFIIEIIEQGETLYEANHARVG